ncbi:MAG: glycosyltransferase family 4 protein [Fulvivirga sp.]
MKIAQISPLYESVPPKTYGGTERVVSYLTEALIRKGHDVTLFASGDSKTNARLISNVSEALRLKEGVEDTLAHHIVQLQEVIERMNEFDMVHFHTDYLHFPFTYQTDTSLLTTLHGRLDISDLQYVYNKFKKQPLVSISYAQRKPLPQANWIANAYHGLPLDLYTQGEGNGNYLFFLGRISHEKGPDQAIEIAKRAGMKIKIAAKIDKEDQLYYHQHIKKLMKQPHVEFLGEVGEVEKTELLTNATGLLFPIVWPEPFGMVIIESLACGTPIIAYDNGSIPEIINEDETGYIVEGIDAAVKAVERIKQLDRGRIRTIFEERFSDDVMADNYITIYSHLLAKKTPVPSLLNKKNGKIKESDSQLVA